MTEHILLGQYIMAQDPQNPFDSVALAIEYYQQFDLTKECIIIWI